MTTSRVNSLLMTHAAMQRWIWNLRALSFQPKILDWWIKWNEPISVCSDQNIRGQLWRLSTWTGQVISVGPTEMPLSIWQNLLSPVPLFSILLTRIITKRAVAYVVGRVCATGMYRSIGHVELPKLQTGIFVEWKATYQLTVQIPNNRYGYTGTYTVVRVCLHGGWVPQIGGVTRLSI